MMPTIRILLVDDEANILDVCQRILEADGYQVESVQSGHDALEQVKRQSFDLLVTDIKMPGMDGLELVQAVKEVAPHLPCVIMTGFSTMDTTIKALKLGVDEYVLKPFDPEELKMAIGRALEKTNLHQQVKELRNQLATEQSRLSHGADGIVHDMRNERLTSKPNWFYDETKHSGVDYNSLAQVQAYDEKHQKFRDYEKASQAIIRRLGLGSGDTVIDMGAGTGAFALCAARACKTVYAVDVSQAMVDYARQKAEQAGLKNIVFCQGGFLTYEHVAEPADALVSTAVLHHLPDFWKLVGLRRVNEMLKPGGRLFLFDVVFSSDMAGYEARFDEWVSSFARNVGPDFAVEAEIHIRDEHSTYDWVMEGLLRRAGFGIDSAEYDGGFGATYVCTKK
jgi:CheY-like chemotaxis protein/ubiquinone/menaquinone biosynthesis C-methylase UbiE